VGVGGALLLLYCGFSGLMEGEGNEVWEGDKGGSGGVNELEEERGAGGDRHNGGLALVVFLQAAARRVAREPAARLVVPERVSLLQGIVAQAAATATVAVATAAL
jgi:hypothetical protein